MFIVQKYCIGFASIRNKLEISLSGGLGWIEWPEGEYLVHNLGGQNDLVGGQAPESIAKSDTKE